MAFSDHDPEDIASVGFSAGWIELDPAIPIPAKSARSLQAADIQGQREDDQRRAREEAHTDAWMTRYRIAGEEPPSLQEVLDRVGRRGLAEDRRTETLERQQAEVDASEDRRTPQQFIADLKTAAARKVRGKRESARERRQAARDERKRKQEPQPWASFK
jgi:hypothetical protein